MKRVHKFKSNKKEKLVLKLIAIVYITIACLSLITTPSTASFYSENTQEGLAKAGEWWDGSELVFTEKGTEPIQGCAPHTIESEVKNIGKDMKQSATYEVYYSENGNAEKQGTRVESGELAPLKSEEFGTVTFDAQKNGSYVFRILQHSEFNNDNKQHDDWSGKIKIKCVPNQKGNADETSEVKEQQEKDQAEKLESEEVESEKKQEKVNEKSNSDEEENAESDSQTEDADQKPSSEQSSVEEETAVKDEESEQTQSNNQETENKEEDSK